ncbi:MAG: PCRF domain-containing protein, partial [Methyloceanibacter sp.]
MTTIPADRLDKLVARWQAVQGSLASGSDQESYVRLSREFAELDPIVATINALRQAMHEREDLQALVDDPASDKDMADLAAQELTELDPKIEDLEQRLKVQLLPKDAADEKSAILELRAGTGGEEAALFAGDLFRMYQRYADRRGWKVSVLSASESATGGYKE